MMREHVLKKKMENKKARLSSSRFFFIRKKKNFLILGKKIVCPKEFMVLEKECAIIRSDNFLGEKKRKIMFFFTFFLIPIEKKNFCALSYEGKKIGGGE